MSGNRRTAKNKNSRLHGKLFNNVATLNTVNQRSTAPYCSSDMNGFCHLIEIRSALEALIGIRIDTVRALDSVGNSKTDKRFLPLCQRSLGRSCLRVPCNEFL